jgi:hypothetical protein
MGEADTASSDVVGRLVAAAVTARGSQQRERASRTHAERESGAAALAVTSVMR